MECKYGKRISRRKGTVISRSFFSVSFKMIVFRNRFVRYFYRYRIIF